VRYALPQPYRDLDHTADAGVEVEGASPSEVLARLVLAQSALLAGGERVAVERDERVVLRTPEGAEGLAVSLLRELLYRFSTERLMAGECEVMAFEPGVLVEANIGFGRYDPDLHAEGLDLKAVTRHAARFEEVDGRWRARVVFDV
jgi:SHS2 domain-containing protein